MIAQECQHSLKKWSDRVAWLHGRPSKGGPEGCLGGFDDRTRGSSTDMRRAVSTFSDQIVVKIIETAVQMTTCDDDVINFIPFLVALVG